MSALLDLHLARTLALLALLSKRLLDALLSTHRTRELFGDDGSDSSEDRGLSNSLAAHAPRTRHQIWPVTSKLRPARNTDARRSFQTKRLCISFLLPLLQRHVPVAALEAERTKNTRHWPKHQGLGVARKTRAGEKTQRIKATWRSTQNNKGEKEKGNQID